MTMFLIIVFLVTYCAIALEEVLHINKAASALVGAGLLWTAYALGGADPHLIDEELAESLVATAQIAFFLMGAMTIVEVIDAHDGFEIVTSRLRATKLAGLAWFLAGVTFVLSAILDNLTTTIVMVSLLGKLLREREHRLWLTGVIVIAANAGGAWSPIGDVTTTMLWIGGQVTTQAIVTRLFLPSLVNLAVPLAFVSYLLRGRAVVAPKGAGSPAGTRCRPFERNLMFALGLATLVAVPAFKAITHLPPYLGVLFGLGILWAVGDLIHRKKEAAERGAVTIGQALTRIDMSAIVFFVGILLAVATLEHTGILSGLAAWLDTTVGRLDVIVLLFGLLSAIVDNVPMVAAAMGMYDLGSYPPDSFLWEFMAYAAGTGGSILIVGSAAGVAAMGIEKVEFLWYARRIAPLALLGYLAGAGTYLLQTALVG
jgi:Na+/H+ antiporter NhaD/arsenite permease-like protein